jgi:hypothetical protein
MRVNHAFQKQISPNIEINTKVLVPLCNLSSGRCVAACITRIDDAINVLCSLESTASKPDKATLHSQQSTSTP